MVEKLLGVCLYEADESDYPPWSEWLHVFNVSKYIL